MPVIVGKVWEEVSMRIGMVASSQTAKGNGQSDKRIGVEEAWDGTPICKLQAVSACSQLHGNSSQFDRPQDILTQCMPASYDNIQVIWRFDKQVAYTPSTSHEESELTSDCCCLGLTIAG